MINLPRNAPNVIAQIKLFASGAPFLIAWEALGAFIFLRYQSSPKVTQGSPSFEPDTSMEQAHRLTLNSQRWLFNGVRRIRNVKRVGLNLGIALKARRPGNLLLSLPFIMAPDSSAAPGERSRIANKSRRQYSYAKLSADEK